MKRLFCLMLVMALAAMAAPRGALAGSGRIGSDEELLEALAEVREKNAVGFQLVLKTPYLEELTEEDGAGFTRIAVQAGMTDYKMRYSSDGDLKLDDVKWTEPHVAACATEEEFRRAVEGMLAEGVPCCQITVEDKGVFDALLENERAFTWVLTCGAHKVSIRHSLHEPYIIYLDNIGYYPGYRIVKANEGNEFLNLTRRELKTLDAAAEMAETCRRADPLETARAVHDALCDTIVYTDMASTDEDDNAIGALLNGKANCDGYADAFYLVGTLAGLEVRYQHGESLVRRNADDGERDVTHMWNVMRIDGTWRMVDVTWDDQESGTVYTWFNIGADRARQTHRWDEAISVPLAETTEE